MKKRKLFLLLSKFSDCTSKMISVVTRSYFSHASLGLDEDKNTFYSFNLKGFIIEKISRFLHMRKKLPCELYELEVSEDTYRSVKSSLSDFIATKEKHHYSLSGLILSLFHIPHKSRQNYFCSQFVAYILERCQAVKLQKNSSLYFPKDLKKIPGIHLSYSGDMQKMPAQGQFCMG